MFREFVRGEWLMGVEGTARVVKSELSVILIDSVKCELEEEYKLGLPRAFTIHVGKN